MGKAQSKRSVDITTEVKEGNAEEGTGKMGKIEDGEVKPQQNGDTNHKEGAAETAAEIKDETENEKDSATEKPKVDIKTPEEGAGDAATSADQTKENGTEKATEAAENGNDTTVASLDESKVSEAVEGAEDAAASSTPVSDSAKKQKKEKPKKRFLSFRSFSFSKKDKQKPAKKEEAAATNGEIEKVPEETTEDAANPATETAKTDNDKAEQQQITTNGASDEAKATDDAKPIENATPAVETAPAAKKEEAPAKPVVAEPIKPVEEVKKAAEATVEEAIVNAAKSVDEKINVVSKPEVNQQQNVVTSEPIEQSLEQNTVTVATNSDQSNAINNNNQLNDTSVGSGDCTNINNNNPLPPPPLPDCPPPSQLSVFAETAMSPENNNQNNTADTATLLSAPEQPQPIPIISTDVQSEIPLVGSTKIEVASTADSVVSQVLENAQTIVDEKLKSDADTKVSEASETVTAAIVEPIITEVVKLSEDTKTIEPESLPKPEEIAETIAILDSVNESEVKLTDDVSNTNESKQITSDGDELADVSVDISSPLPQNSLESLPSPELSNVSPPPSETDENIASESIAADDKLPPPPAAVDDVLINEKLTSAVADLSLENSNTDELSNTTEIAHGNDLLPPPPSDVEVVNAPTDDNKIVTTNGDVKTNGDTNEHTNGEILAETPTTNGGCHDNGSEAVILSDKENGFEKTNGIDKENGITETLNGNGDHKKIDEIVPTPEKLEKAAGIQPPSTEVVAAE